MAGAISPSQQMMLEEENRVNATAKSQTQKTNLELWRDAASAILEAILTGREALNVVQQEGVQMVHFPDGRWQRLYGILLTHIHGLGEGDVVNPQEIMHLWAGAERKWTTDEQSWFEKRLNFSKAGNKVFHKQTLKKNIPLLKQYAKHGRIDDQVRLAYDDFAAGRITADQLVHTLPDTLQRIQQSSIKATDVVVTGDKIGWDEFETAGSGLILSPSPLFNHLFKGIRHGGITVVCGEQKSGKSRFTYAHALYTLMQGESVAIFSLEERKGLAQRRLGAMLMYQYIVDKFGETTTDRWGNLLQDIDLDWWMMKEGQDYLKIPPRAEARAFAKGMFEQWGNKLRIYDEADGVINFAGLQGWLKTDCAAYGVPCMTVIDHTHHMVVPVGKGDNSNQDYTRLKHVAGPLHQHAVGTGTAMMLLAQRNVEANKNEQGAGNKLGIKGGEELSEKCLLGMVVRGQIGDEGEETIGRFHFYVRAQRFGQPHAGSIGIDIHPSTGWILSAKSIKSDVN